MTLSGDWYEQAVEEEVIYFDDLDLTISLANNIKRRTPYKVLPGNIPMCNSLHSFLHPRS